MTQPRLFPPLKESNVRRLGSASAFQKGMLLWDDDGVRNPTVSTEDAIIFANVYDGPHRTCQVMVRHLAGDEFATKCDCDQSDVCSHAVATLLAWAHESYAFTQVEELGTELAAAAEPRRQWYNYLNVSNIQHLRAIARRHQLKLKGNERARVLAQVLDLMADPATPQRALENLSEAQRRVLQMVFVLSDGQPDTFAPDIQRAFGWQNLAVVEDTLRELSEWGLVVAVPSQWHRAVPYTLAPAIATLLSSVSAAIGMAGDQILDKPRNDFIEPFAGDVATLPTLCSHHSILEILLLARRLPLHLRPAQPELAQARTIKVLRHWPYLIDELVNLQVRPGWLHQSESVLTVPPPEPRYDDESLARLRELTADDALSEFASHLLPLPSALTPPSAGAAVGSRQAEARVRDIPSPSPPQRAYNPSLVRDVSNGGRSWGMAVVTLRQIFAQWQQLSSWTELWLAQQTGALTVRRAVMGAQLGYLDWLGQLARGRRFITRVLALLAAGHWYDFESLLKFVHTLHADFLRDRSHFPNVQPGWWLEVRGKKVDPQKFEQWRASHGLFIEHILRGPLLWLGAVELILAPLPLSQIGSGNEAEGAGIRAFQLTLVGEALLRGRSLPAPQGDDAPLRLTDDLQAQLPLGRHDISAYLTLEPLARFECVRDGVAHYQFDARQAHAAFERGLTAADILSQLEQLSGAPVPPHVRTQWNDWWSRYAQVRWYDGLTLIEFADDYALQELLTQTDLAEHLVFTFGPRLVAVRPESADAVSRQLMKKGYTPRIE